MRGLTRWNPYQELFNFQREVDQLFNRFWSDLPTGAANGPSTSFQVASDEQGWHIDVPIPGIDPKDVALEAAGNTLSIRAEGAGNGQERTRVARYEQTLTLPQFLDLDKISASYQHGMLKLTVPLKESVRPKRIRIEAAHEDQKQLAGANA